MSSIVEWERAWAESSPERQLNQGERRRRRSLSMDGLKKLFASTSQKKNNRSLLHSVLKGGENREVCLLLAYTCVGITSRALCEVVEKSVSRKQVVDACDEAGLRFRLDDVRLSWCERKTGVLSIRARASIRRRVRFLTAVFRSLGGKKKNNSSSSGQQQAVTMRRVQKSLVALGEHVSLQELIEHMSSTGEHDLEQLDHLDLVHFLKLMGSLDAADRGILHTRQARRLRKTLPTRSLTNLVRLFIELDRDLTGVISCCDLATTIRNLSKDDASLPGQRGLYNELALAVAKSSMRDTDYFDFEEFVQFSAESVAGPSTKRRMAVKTSAFSSSGDIKSRVDTRGVPWRALFADYLPIEGSSVRANALKQFLASVSEKQMLLLQCTTRDGSNLLHYVAERGDAAACKLLLARPRIRMMVCDKNRAGHHPPATAFLAHNDECESILRSWMGFALDVKMQHRAEKHRRLYAASTAFRQNTTVHLVKKDNPDTKKRRRRRHRRPPSQKDKTQEK